MLLKFSTGLLLFSGALYAIDKATEGMRHSHRDESRFERRAEAVAERIAERAAARAASRARVHVEVPDDADADSVIEREFVAKPGERLDIDLKAGGAIRITGWDEQKVAATAFLQGDECDEYRVSLLDSETGVTIRSRARESRHGSECEARYEVRVPNRFDVSAETMGGDVKIADVKGDIRGKTMGGSLDLTGLKGQVHMTTMGGEVSLTKSDVDGEVKTMGGEVRLEDVVGDVKGSTMGGNVYYTRVTRRPGSASGRELVRISTMGGDINVDEAPGGADVNTMGGSIRVGRADGFVKAKTMGGSIEIDAVDGGVTATTMAGDITVTVVGDGRTGNRDVRLQSHSGDVTLTLPENFSANVDVTVAYTRGKDGEYEIVSDFPLQTRETAEWDRSHGEPRRYLYGTAAIGGGRHTVRLETVNGNVYLKKADRDR